MFVIGISPVPFWDTLDGNDELQCNKKQMLKLGITMKETVLLFQKCLDKKQTFRDSVVVGFFFV